MTAQPEQVDCYITFGQKYRTERHPSWPLAHPDGWLRVTAASYEQARAVGVAITDSLYAFDYPTEHFQREHFPLGELHHIEVAPGPLPLDARLAPYAGGGVA